MFTVNIHTTNSESLSHETDNPQAWDSTQVNE